MTTTIKRISFCSTKETEKCLEELKEMLGETRSNLIKRAIYEMHKRAKHTHDAFIGNLDSLTYT